jgi:hypothetical protein
MQCSGKVRSAMTDVGDSVAHAPAMRRMFDLARHAAPATCASYIARPPSTSIVPPLK